MYVATREITWKTNSKLCENWVFIGFCREAGRISIEGPFGVPYTRTIQEIQNQHLGNPEHISDPTKNASGR